MRCCAPLLCAVAGIPIAPAPPPPRVLFRGPRLKVGVDVGRVHADVNPVTGRMQVRQCMEHEW